ncbi:sigma-70 family RNA polymerase sigma factor [Actinomadura sp. 3N508]|uniref:sigma-70 family RNA polymerase sigma factor n=1 Tax=Actinomadura sp. 3N508 TaxID=3375153 RepID=UPI00378C07EB
MSARDADVPAAEDFLSQAGPFRRELTAYCYRMLGSVHDAEDLVQETYLRGWRYYDRFEGRASMRTWLYRIATSVCLAALRNRERRPLPSGLGAPAGDPLDDHTERHDVPWLEPIPDDMADPAAAVVARESVRLAFIAALQHLPPRQRAVLILRDVLNWHAAEVAQLLGTTTTAVHSALRRARTQLGKVAPAADEIVEPSAADQRRLLDRYVDAFTGKDVDAIVELFTADAIWEMPPFPVWFQGRAGIRDHLTLCCPLRAGEVQLHPTSANGQPAFAAYLRGPDGSHRAAFIQVLTVTAAGISHATLFQDPGLFPAFGLPPSLPARAMASAR